MSTVATAVDEVCEPVESRLEAQQLTTLAMQCSPPTSATASRLSPQRSAALATPACPTSDQLPLIARCVRFPSFKSSDCDTFWSEQSTPPLHLRSSPPTIPTSAMAESLPFHLLVSVFFAARDGNDDPDTFDHGGDLVHWDSMESAADFTLVSKAWLDAGVFALYRSISIIGEDAAELFLRTIRDRPERAASVRSLVIGLLNDEEDDAEAESNKLLEVLESCPLITSLQVRPLHPAVRHRLLSAIQSKRLTSLVCLPRIDNDQDTESVYRSTDLLKLVTPSLVRLEVDFWAKPDHLVLSTPCPLPSFPPLALVDFRSFSSGSDAVVLNILKMSGPTLENVIVYFENLFPDSKFVADALATSMGTLRTLTFVSTILNLASHPHCISSVSTRVLSTATDSTLPGSHLHRSRTRSLLSSTPTTTHRRPRSLTRSYRISSGSSS